MFNWLRRLVADRRVVRLRKQQRLAALLAKGEMLNAVKAATTVRQAGCNHRKGGWISPDGMSISMGTVANDYAVIKHAFPWGDIWVRCLRCGKNWKPGMPDYMEALMFPTNNKTSGSVQFRNVTAKARELTKDAVI